MCVVKIVPGDYCNTKAIYNLINYAMKPSHCICGLYGASGMLIGTAKEMEMAMWNLKEEFRKDDGRLVMHIVISFDKKMEGWITPEHALYFGYAFVDSILAGYQTVFGVHDNEDNIHIHVIINTVSYITGRKLGFLLQDSFIMAKKMNEIIESYISSGRSLYRSMIEVCNPEVVLC